jgi:hypothetical protein
MKKCYYPVLAALLFAAHTTKAQSLSQTVVATAGNEMLTPDLAFSYTIGEPCVLYYLNTTPIVTEGFQQNTMLISGLGETPASTNLSVFPNPFGQSFTLSFNGLVDAYEFVITDALGRIVNVLTNCTGSSCIVDMNGLPSGVYLLTVLRNGEQAGAYRVVKTSL